jgi:hypothetical protein
MRPRSRLSKRRRTGHSAFWLYVIAAGMLTAGTARSEEPRHYTLAVSALEEQAPSPRMLAACAYDSKSQRMLVFGGSTGAPGDASAGLLCLDLEADHWRVLEVSGEEPKGTGCPAMVYVEDEDALYLFGGWPRDATEPVDELWMLALAGGGDLRWQRLPREGDWPAGRNGCCMVYDAERRRLIMHAGDGGPRPVYGYTPLDDLWEFDLAAKRWHRLKPSGTVPKPRWNHAAVVDQSRGVMFIYGGSGYTADTPIVRDQSISALDLRTLRWRRLPAAGTRPPPLMGMCLSYDPPSGLLLLIGGLSLADAGEPGPRSVWCYDIDQQTWTEHKDLLPTTRRNHVAVYDPERKRHVIFGGCAAIKRQDFYAKGTPLADSLAIVVRELTE